VTEVVIVAVVVEVVVTMAWSGIVVVGCVVEGQVKGGGSSDGNGGKGGKHDATSRVLVPKHTSHVCTTIDSPGSGGSLNQPTNERWDISPQPPSVGVRAKE
jgi:hypothetical protein